MGKRTGVASNYGRVTRQRRLKQLATKARFLKIGAKPFKRVLLAVVFACLSLALFALGSSNSFDVKTIVITSSQEFVDAENLLNGYKGRSIFQVSQSEIEAKVRDAFPNAREVYVLKMLPDQLYVDIVQRTPVLVVANLDELVLLDRRGEAIQPLPLDTSVKLLDYQKKLLQGLGDVSAAYVKDAYLADLSEEERESLKWEEVPLAKKEEVLQQLEHEVAALIDTFQQSVFAFMSESSFGTLPIVFSFSEEELDKTKLDLIIDVSDALKLHNIFVRSSAYLSNFTLEVALEDGKRILFSHKRSLLDQLEDLESIMYHGYYSDARVIDLRSEVYSLTK